jgi:hypothetical protein
MQSGVQDPFLAFFAAFFSLGVKADFFLVSLLLFCSLPMVFAPGWLIGLAFPELYTRNRDLVSA